MPSNSFSIVETIDQLDALYGQPPEGSLLKEIDHLSDEYRRWLEAAPFVALATIGPEGMDCTPRGDRDQAVFVDNERTLHLPDRRGNNRLDSLRNIVRDGRVGLLFLLPGVSECLRVNGTAVVTTDVGLRSRYAVEGKEPATVIVISVQTVYFQCARAIKRSALWDPATRTDPGLVPTAGQMTKGARASDFDAESYDAALQDRQASSLY